MYVVEVYLDMRHVEKPSSVIHMANKNSNYPAIDVKQIDKLNNSDVFMNDESSRYENFCSNYNLKFSENR